MSAYWLTSAWPLRTRSGDRAPSRYSHTGFANSGWLRSARITAGVEADIGEGAIEQIGADTGGQGVLAETGLPFGEGLGWLDVEVFAASEPRARMTAGAVGDQGRV